MKQVTVIGLFCLLAILVTQNGCTKKEPPSAGNETTNEASSESHQPEQGKVITNSIGMKLVYMPAGSFMMGSNDHKIESPPHEVHISEGFWMGQTEVTQGQYESVMNAQPWSGQEEVQESANNPAVYVSWDDAVEFCRKLSQQEGKMYRLPTEAEWEYACRAGTTTRFSFGDSASSLGDYAWTFSNTFQVGQNYAHSVGQKNPNPWGLYDIHGNVYEWCSDWYDTDYYSNSPSVDPNGLSSGGARCLRGGTWRINGSLRCSSRYASPPFLRLAHVGFRVVRSLSGPQVEPDRGPERPEVAAEEPVEAALLPKAGDAAGDAVTNSIGMKLVYIPAGSFMMGSGDSAAQLAKEYRPSEEYFAGEFPRHQVRISEGFWMGQTEVTQGQYTSVMNAQPWSGKPYVQEDTSNPAVCVSWDDAVAFCRKLSQQEGRTYRLPTEAEWEYACRAGTTTQFSFGDSDSSLGAHAWFKGNAVVDQKYAHRVGQKKPNPWGLYDMHGNIWEWCSDYYSEDYYSHSPSGDPKGPPIGGARCSRGGSWLLPEYRLRCSYRVGGFPGLPSVDVGFRVVREK